MRICDSQINRSEVVIDINTPSMGRVLKYRIRIDFRENLIERLVLVEFGVVNHSSSYIRQLH